MKVNTMVDRVHEGRNVKRIREILGIKQDTLASELGLSQQAVSQMEQREMIDPDLLDKVAKQLGVPVDAIKKYNDEVATNIIANTFNDNSANNFNYQCTINPIEKIVELYDALLKSEKEKIALLERMLEDKKNS